MKRTPEALNHRFITKSPLYARCAMPYILRPLSPFSQEFSSAAENKRRSVHRSIPRLPLFFLLGGFRFNFVLRNAEARRTSGERGMAQNANGGVIMMNRVGIVYPKSLRPVLTPGV